MPATVVDAVQLPYPCPCRCHERLTLDERVAGITALYRFDDAMRGWGQAVTWDVGGPVLWRVQQRLGEVAAIAVRSGACLFGKLVGRCTQDVIRALCGEPAAPNFGVPVGVPYGVPDDVPPADEAAYLAPHNQVTARAQVGVAALAERLFGITWPLEPASDAATYVLPGGSAIVAVPPGFRSVPHLDRLQQPRRHAMAVARLEDEARAWFTPERLDELAARFEAAEAVGRSKRPRAYPAPKEVARLRPKPPGRNDLCLCGSMNKWKLCCGATP